MNRSPALLLAAALATDPGRPFVTFYDEATGERIELSVTTFANWVAKTANLLVDGLGLAPGDVVHLDLPRHWQTPVWAVAAWSAGLTLDLDGNLADAALAVCGPDGIASAQAAADVVAVSLRPLGAPFPVGALPAGVYDYGREVAGYGDHFSPTRTTSPLLTGGGPALTEEAEQRGAAWGLGEGGRLLVAAPLSALDDLLAATLIPLLRSASVVLVVGGSAERIGVIADAERVTARSAALAGD